MTIPILALDLSSKTGWALMDRNGILTSGVQVFDLKRGESKGMRFLRFRKWFKELSTLGELGKTFSENEPGIVAFEEPHFRGGAATELLVGFSTNVLAEAALIGAEHVGVHSGTLKKFATGKGNAGKEDVIKKVRSVYPSIEIEDDNHADALMLLSYIRTEAGI